VASLHYIPHPFDKELEKGDVNKTTFIKTLLKKAVPPEDTIMQGTVQ